MLSRMLQQMWWVPLVRGIIAILFGIVVLTKPGIALVSLIVVVGAYLITEGLFSVIHALRGRKETPRWWLLLAEGLLAIILGVYTLASPGMASLALLYLIAAWAVVSGFVRIFLAIALRKEIRGEWWLALNGVASVLLGLIMMARPGAGALALLWLIGFWSILVGIALVALAIKARRFGKTLAPLKGTEAAGA